tara:strand:+ start:682 stop:792 length:111 start_codon:yes stop_codon:yes gene_type:complete
MKIVLLKTEQIVVKKHQIATGAPMQGKECQLLSLMG